MHIWRKLKYKTYYSGWIILQSISHTIYKYKRIFGRWRYCWFKCPQFLNWEFRSRALFLILSALTFWCRFEFVFSSKSFRFSWNSRVFESKNYLSFKTISFWYYPATNFIHIFQLQCWIARNEIAIELTKWPEPIGSIFMPIATDQRYRLCLSQFRSPVFLHFVIHFTSFQNVPLGSLW